MGHANNRITGPLNTSDVSITLGEASHDVYTLCHSRKAKAWARYKPMAIDQIQDINDTLRAARNWGITNIPHFNNAAAMAQFLIDGSMGDSSVSLGPWFVAEAIPENILTRLTDFVSSNNDNLGYWHGAKEPLELSANDIIILPGAVTINMTPLDPAQIKLTELSVPGSMAAGMGQMYLGLLVTDGTESRIETLTEPFSTIENAGGSHSISLPTGITGNCTLCAVLCSRTYTWDDYLSSSPDTPMPASNGTDGTDTPIVVSDYVPLTWTKQTITLVRPVAEITCDGIFGEWDPDKTTDEAGQPLPIGATITFTLTNHSDISGTLRNIKFSIAGFPDGAKLGEKSMSDLTVPANETITRSVYIEMTTLCNSYVYMTYDLGGETHQHRGKVAQKDTSWIDPDEPRP